MIALVIIGARTADANDRVAELTKLVSSSSNEKTRLSAVAALSRIDDKRAMKPLVTALGDPSAKIRLVAAVALGKLGHKAALPALRSAASDDADADVRTKARLAAVTIAKANQLPDPFTADAAASVDPRPRTKAGFGNAPRALVVRPDLYVLIKTSTDDSPGKADKKARKDHADIIRASLAEQCTHAANVTSQAQVAQRFGLDLKNVDLSVVKLDVTPSGSYMEIEASLRLAISDNTGKMLSFVSGGAKVQVPKRTYDPKYLPTLRKEALENAMRGMFDKLIAHLRNQPRS
ncbi:MAG: HEAT repeat domain-containing protein [Deltaproteobacteria bacterium]|nr:HEAT repeat domain-containing protein [Deltaproteobacteria bacterium]